jgi:cytochrome c553
MGPIRRLPVNIRTVIIKQLADIRARNRDNPLMYPFSVPRVLGGPQNIADVAAYLAQLPMNPHNGVGPGTDLELGAQLYQDNCVKCHGDRGQGDEQEHIAGHRGPALQLSGAPVRCDSGRPTQELGSQEWWSRSRAWRRARKWRCWTIPRACALPPNVSARRTGETRTFRGYVYPGPPPATETVAPGRARKPQRQPRYTPALMTLPVLLAG